MAASARLKEHKIIRQLLIASFAGRLDESISVSERGLKHLPDEPGLHFNLGNIYGKQGRWMESEKEYLKALKLSPNKSLYYGNFGE